MHLCHVHDIRKYVISIIGNINFDHLVQIAACFLPAEVIYTHRNFTAFKTTVQLFLTNTHTQKLS